MFGLSKLKKQSRSSEPTEERKTDKAIIHQSVPEEVLATESSIPKNADMSWLDDTPVPEAKQPDSGPRREQQPRPATKPATKPVHAQALVLDQAVETPAAANEPPQQSANPASSARPPCPVGWMVVVEGPGVGEWFVLERGASHIGSSEGQTIRLDFGDQSVAPVCHAEVRYDHKRHGFVLACDPAMQVRRNGIPVASSEFLSDGDVVSVGSTALRLVALCSQNFNWDEFEHQR